MAKEVHVSQLLSSRKIMELLDKHPDLERIKCPRSICLRTSKKYLDALSELGIEVEPVETMGRPKKYKKEPELIQKLLDDGKSPDEVAEELNIPVKTVYYLKSSKFRRGRRSKYSPEVRGEIKKLHEEGVSVKEISQKLQIPLRTVYYILKQVSP
ncbi:helix-turn-helix domain-containing protein [Methanobacterium aggregans]|uniref:helix-turn-helix domain-containing protein n=1 Tax=Methanobacterium aggregans TaxID=1615586 RepID=UPI00320E4160